MKSRFIKISISVFSIFWNEYNSVENIYIYISFFLESILPVFVGPGGKMYIVLLATGLIYNLCIFQNIQVKNKVNLCSDDQNKAEQTYFCIVHSVFIM